MASDEQIIFGDHSYSKENIRIVGGNQGHVYVGKYSCLGENISCFMSNDHNAKNISIFPFGHLKMKITKLMKTPLPKLGRFKLLKRLVVIIGNDVWIGSNTVIFREVNIGDGAIVGAYSKITKDVPPYTIVVGENRIIGKRFPDEDIDFLLKLKWWNKSDEEVASIGDILCSPDINKLRRIYG